MNNTELFLMGDANPYADATHYLTVGIGTAGNVSRAIGFADYDTNLSGHFGDLTPRVVADNTVLYLLSWGTSGAETTAISGVNGTVSAWQNLDLLVTRLDTNESKKLTYDPAEKIYVEHKTSGYLFKSADEGKKIPLKIETIEWEGS